MQQIQKQLVERKNEYGDLIEKWKVALVRAKARKKGFREDELDDAQQDVIQAVMAFRFDSAKSNGATEKTAVSAVINKRLTFIERSRARQHKRLENYRAFIESRADNPNQELLEDAPQNRIGIALDVREAVAGLPSREQAICAALSRGENRMGIARCMKLSRYEINRIIDRIRERFETAGLNAWGGY